jgi:hypothetical protein
VGLPYRLAFVVEFELNLALKTVGIEALVVVKEGRSWTKCEDVCTSKFGALIEPLPIDFRSCFVPTLADQASSVGGRDGLLRGVAFRAC